MTGNLDPVISMMSCRSKPTDRGGAVTGSRAPAAVRQRVYRARKRAGARFMRGDLSGEVIDALIAEGWLGRADPASYVRRTMRALSSVGRVTDLRSVGHRFDPCRVHQGFHGERRLCSVWA